MSRCVFCAIVANEAPAEVVATWPYAIAIVPLNPIAEGHTLIIPRVHVADATVDPQVTADTMRCAALWAQPPCNIITSAGLLATQTVFHLHVHVVPRVEGDGLLLPWSLGPGMVVLPDESGHYVTFAADGWFIEHSIACRVAGTLGTCRYNDSVRVAYGDDPGPETYGRWRITAINSEGRPCLEAAPLAEP